MSDAVVLALLGVAVLAEAAVRRGLDHWPVPVPLSAIALGYAVFALPIGLTNPDPIGDGVLAEHIAEVGVIVALMGAGLRIDRPTSLRGWASTWRLLGITMPLTIAGVAVLGWWAVGLAPAAAFLLGSVLAPTDPVLASDVQVDPPGAGEEHEVRFALSSEAGLNDALAFPFVNAAIAAATAGALEWAPRWALVDVAWKLGAGVGLGLILGRALSYLVFDLQPTRHLAEEAEGLVAVGGALAVYGLTELAHGYGFLAVFIAARTIRGHERDHSYHEVLHDTAVNVERLLTVVVLVLFGGALAGGVLEPLTLPAAAVAASVVLLIRPVVGIGGLIGSAIPWRQRLAIGFFGIRGVGSFFYLAHALNEEDFPGAEILWATVALAVLLSVVVHGVAATPVMRRLTTEESEATGG